MSSKNADQFLILVSSTETVSTDLDNKATTSLSTLVLNSIIKYVST